MSDEADNLNAKTLPIPTAQRLDVFVCGHLNGEPLERWRAQGGDSTFHLEADARSTGRDPAEFCGIVLFVVGANGHLDETTSKRLAAFYERAGKETNAFQWQPIEKNFVRRDRHWFNERRTD